MGHPNRNMDDIGAEGGLNSVGWVQKAFDEKNVNMFPGDGVSDILVKNVASF